MIPLILIGLIAGLPVVMTLLLRVNTVFLFLSMLVGDVLVKYLSDDVILALSGFMKSARLPMIAQLCLLFLPVVLTVLILRKSLPKSKVLIHILPLVFVGLSLAVLTLPLLTSGTQAAIFNTSAGRVLRNAQDLIVSVAGILVLMLAWQAYKHKPDKKHK